MQLCRVSLFLLGAPALLCAQAASRAQFVDTAVIPFFHKANPQIVSFTTFYRKDLDGQHSLLLVRGSPHVPSASDDRSDLRYTFWEQSDLLGVFLVANADPNRVWELAMIPNSPDYSPGRVEVDRVDAGSIVLRLFVSDYGLSTDWLKLFFDINSKQLLGQVRYPQVSVEKIVMPFWESAFVPNSGRLYLLGNLAKEPVVAAWDWERAEATLINGEERQEVLANLANIGQRDISRVAPYRHDWHFRNDWDDGRITFLPIDFNKRFFVSFRNSGTESLADGVAERTEDGYRFYPFPQSSMEEHRRQRPELDEQQGRAVDWIIEEKIGPYQITQGTLDPGTGNISGERFWFAKTFYDGEGHSGVGGVGYFDPEAKRFVTFSPPEMAPWSASALTVALGSNDVWVGLVRQPEGGAYSGGLLRYEPETGSAQKYELGEIVLAIYPFSPAYVFLGTTNGIYLLRNGSFRRYVIEPDLNGAFQVISADLPD